MGGSTRTTLDAVKDPVLLMARSGVIKIVNATAATLFNSTAQGLRGRRFSALFPPAEAEVWQDAIQSVAKNGQALRFERRMADRDFDVSLESVQALSGKVSGITLHARDITARKQAEARLRQSEAMLRTVIDQIPHWVLWKDWHSRFLGCNRAFAEAVGVATPDDIVGLTDNELNKPETAELLRREDEEILRTGGTLVRTAQFVLARTGAEILIEKIKLPLRSHDGEIVGVIVIASDVTERSRAEQRLVAAKQEAERVNAARLQLIAAGSHDLRQPLQATALFLGLLDYAATDPKLLNLVGKAQAALGSALSLFDDLMNLSKLEAGGVVPAFEPVSLGRLLDRLRDEFTPQAEAKGLRFRIRPSNRVICSDPLLLERILRNLITNAVRYTDRGGILVGCRQRGGYARIEVWDTGIGIPQEQFELIFKEFHQVPSPASNGRGGLGIGLATVRRMAAVLQHSVKVRSKVGRGSLFALEVKPDGSVRMSRTEGKDAR
jgi:PAS domain S-box